MATFVDHPTMTSFPSFGCFLPLRSQYCLLSARSCRHLPRQACQHGRIRAWSRHLKGDRVWNDVATSEDGCVFAVYQQAEGPGVQVAELDPDARARPYPKSV